MMHTFIISDRITWKKVNTQLDYSWVHENLKDSNYRKKTITKCYFDSIIQSKQTPLVETDILRRKLGHMPASVF